MRNKHTINIKHVLATFVKHKYQKDLFVIVSNFLEIVKSNNLWKQLQINIIKYKHSLYIRNTVKNVTVKVVTWANNVWLHCIGGHLNIINT